MEKLCGPGTTNLSTLMGLITLKLKQDYILKWFENLTWLSNNTCIKTPMVKGGFNIHLTNLVRFATIDL
jgi:hypothetical protein